MNEAERFASLRRYDILDSRAEPRFDRIAEWAAAAFEVPMAVIAFASSDAIWCKGRWGCDEANDAAIAPLVLEAIRGASGAVAPPAGFGFASAVCVRSDDGEALGALCIVDTGPRPDLDSQRLRSLEPMARLVESELERRHISNRLESTDELFRDLAQISADWVWHTDADHRLTSLYADFTSRDSISHSGIGRRRWEFSDSKPVRGTWDDHIADLAARREFRGFEYETSEQGEQRAFRLNGRPRYDDAGEFIGYHGTGTDITRRRARELSRALNQRVFATSLDLILATDSKGVLTLVSPSVHRLLGYEPAELIGQSGTTIVHAEDLAAVRNEMRSSRRGQGTRNFDCRYVARDGTVVPFSWTGVWSESDKHHFFMGRDMTERIAAEDRQRRSQRLEAIGQLTGGLAHDFNNILSVMLLRMEAAARVMQEGSPARQMLDSAIAAGARGADLVARMMAFARRQSLNPIEMSVGRLLEEFAALLRTALTSGIELEIEIAGDLKLCRIDRSGLEAALLNLGVNARDAMPSGGRLYIIARNRAISAEDVERQPELRPGDWIELMVRDTGAGMSPEVRERVFEPFFTTKAEGRGTGLGLPMVHGFVHQSGGFLNLASELGKGTTFWLYLPAIERTSAAEPAPMVA